MNDHEMYLSNLEIANWANALREESDHIRQNQILEAMRWGQLASKGWLINKLTNYAQTGSSIHIFGGWVGLLANMLFQSRISPNFITNIDFDSWCVKPANIINITYLNQSKFKHIDIDMADFVYDHDSAPAIVINTSTEHISQDTYNIWYDRIPNDYLIVTQGNNLYSFPDHIRCSSSLDEFKQKNKVYNELYSGELKINSYVRYMSIWRK